MNTMNSKGHRTCPKWLPALLAGVTLMLCGPAQAAVYSFSGPLENRGVSPDNRESIGISYTQKDGCEHA